MIDLIEGKVTPLAANPRIGRTGRKRGTYELVAHESYIVIYRVLAKKIEVLRVKHTAQQWPPS
jgi:toxin ParE1/3/4